MYIEFPTTNNNMPAEKAERKEQAIPIMKMFRNCVDSKSFCLNLFRLFVNPIKVNIKVIFAINFVNSR